MIFCGVCGGVYGAGSALGQYQTVGAVVGDGGFGADFYHDGGVVGVAAGGGDGDIKGGSALNRLGGDGELAAVAAVGDRHQFRGVYVGGV